MLVVILFVSASYMHFNLHYFNLNLETLCKPASAAEIWFLSF